MLIDTLFSKIGAFQVSEYGGEQFYIKSAFTFCLDTTRKDETFFFNLLKKNILSIKKLFENRNNELF